MKIELAFGILKNVFQSLRCLRIRVNKKSGHQRACEWIAACVVLYNMIRPQLDADYSQDVVPICNNQEFNQNQTDSVQRDKLLNWFIQTYQS